MPPRSPKLPGAGEVITGKYRLERLLKQGGMGSVWVATHLGLDERVAVKFMDPRRVSSAEARMRFTREAKAAAQIRSKNIVQILDHGVDHGVPYIAMELLAGEDLGARLRRAGKLSLGEASVLLDHIAHALDRAHAAGIVHRDLKPENIFLARDGDHEIPKILDFGIALEVQADASDDSAMTQEGVILGTPYFMSPEQVRGRTNIDHRSDLWSVGVILFRAITGIRPFGRGAPADVIVQICSDPLPRASVVARDLPDGVDRFFEKALAREVAKRFASAKEMAAAFAEIARSAEVDERTQQDLGSAFSERPSSRGSRKGPPPLPGAHDVMKTIPSPSGDAEEEAGMADETRPLGMPVPSRSKAAGEGRARSPDSSDAIDLDALIGPGSPSDEAAPAQPDDTDGPDLAAFGVVDAPADTTPEPHDEGTNDATPVAAATTGTMPTREVQIDSLRLARSEEPPPVIASSVPAPAVSAKVPDTLRHEEGRGEGGKSLASVSTSTTAPPPREPRSALWAALGLVLGMAIAGAAFREKLFGPQGGREPTGAATIVLTAGTVVLMTPGGVKAPPTPEPTASASASPGANATATGAPSTTSAPATSAAPSSAPSTPTTSAPATSVTSSNAASTPTTTSAPSTTSAPIGMGTVPSAKPTATATKTATASGGKTETPPKKDERDLGY